MEYRILGPLEVLQDGVPVDTGPRKQRSLLALLLIHANRVVSTDRILDELWGDEADGKENSLWVYVSRLRSALEPDLTDAGESRILRTRDHGYVLNVDESSIDAVAFERAVAKGRDLVGTDPEEAARLLHGALDLWRGSPLQDFTYDEFAQTEIIRLSELRLGATEDAFDADLRRGRAGELIADLEVVQDENPLRERPIALLMLALYRAGRSADALRSFERFRRTIGEELGIDPSPELRGLEEKVLLHDSRLLLPAPRAVRVGAGVDAVNPFKGLRPFQEDDAADFFGRERLVAEVLRRISDDDKLIVLVGPSGSGKSSAVRAGVIPAIRKGAAPGSEHWRVAHMLPGADPFIELEAALLRSSIDAPESLGEALSGDDDSGLFRAALRVLPDDESRLVLVIDQFEELFTLVTDEATRRRFVEQMVKALDDPYGRVILLTTLRSDFYTEAFAYPEFADRLTTGIVNVVPLGSDELEAAAIGPTKASGVAVEPALLAELLTDVIGQPGGLPLFQYALTELFDQRVGDVLSVDTYRSIGGVRGALTRRANELYDSFDSVEQEAARQLLLRLVSIADHDEWSRRRVHASEIVALDVDLVAMQRVIELFTQHRLLSLDRDQVSGAPTVEVAHEALLSEWERLRDWIEQNRESLLRHRELVVAAGVWRQSGRDQDYLYTGRRLDDALAWAATGTIKLTTQEQEFLDAGAARAVAEREAAEEAASRELRLRRSARRRTWGLAAAVVALVAVVAGVVFFATRPEGPKIALVQAGEATGGGIQALIQDGWIAAQRDHDFEGERVVPLIDEDEDMRALADAGYGLIIDGLFDQGQVAYDIAADHPETQFVVFDGQDASVPNVTTISFEREGGAYLMGAAAALQSETGRIGFIGGYQQASTEARRAAYEAGARSVNPDIVVESVYLGPYHDGNNAYIDIDLAKATAEQMYRSGVDVIHHSAGVAAQGIPAAAAELSGELGRDLWVIGSEVDERRLAPTGQADRFLTSMWKRWDKAVEEVVRAYLDGELQPGLLELGLASGGVDYSREGGISDALAAELDRIKAGLISGAFEPTALQFDAPTWTREPALTALYVFDGSTCVSDTGPAGVAVGDVVQVGVVNNSTIPVGLAFGPSEDGVDLADWGRPVTTWTAPGAANGVATRLGEGVYVAQCFTAEASYPSTTFTATFDTVCEGPAPVSTDPADVVEAFVAANNARDAGWVCSLFTEDAEFVGPDGDVLAGNASIAQAVTPYDDLVWLHEIVLTDLEVSDGSAVFSVEWRTADGVLPAVENRMFVDGGKIIRLELSDLG